MSSAHDPPTALPPEVSGAPPMAILSREDLADIVSRAGDRSADRVVARLETMEHKLDSHVSSVDQRLTRVDARLDEIEVRQSSNSFSSSTNVHVAPHTLPLRGSVTTPATPSRPRAGMSSAEGDWNNLSLEERSAWRLRNAGLATHSSPLQEPRPSADVDPDSSFLSKPLYCKPELLPKFNGQPAKLEEWIDRVGDLVRMNRDPRWDSAVVAVIATAFTGPAARWHVTLTTETVERHRSVADIFRAMRKAFPINRGQVRLEAHQLRMSTISAVFAELRVSAEQISASFSPPSASETLAETSQSPRRPPFRRSFIAEGDVCSAKLPGKQRRETLQLAAKIAELRRRSAKVPSPRHLRRNSASPLLSDSSPWKPHETP